MKFTMLAAEPRRGIVALEAAHTSDPTLDATIVLFEAVVQVGAGPVSNGLTKYKCGSLWGRSHTHPLSPARGRISWWPGPNGRTRSPPSCRDDRSASHRSGSRTDRWPDTGRSSGRGPSDRSRRDTNSPRSTTRSEPALAEVGAYDRQKLCLQVPRGLVAHLDPAQRHDLAQVAQGQPIPHPVEHHEGDDIAGKAGPVQHPAAALVELPSAIPAAEPPVAARRHLRTLCHRGRGTAHAFHKPLRPPLRCP